MNGKKSKRIGWLFVDQDTSDKDVKAIQRSIHDFKKLRKVLLEREIKIDYSEMDELRKKLKVLNDHLKRTLTKKVI